jgi:hypothetical protein
LRLGVLVVAVDMLVMLVVAVEVVVLIPSMLHLR